MFKILNRIKNWLIKRDNEQYNLPDQQINALALVWKDPEAKKLIGDSAFSLMKYVIFNDIGSAADAVRSTKALALYTPTILYWDKMYDICAACLEMVLSRSRWLRNSKRIILSISRL